MISAEIQNVKIKKKILKINKQVWNDKFYPLNRLIACK